MDPAQLAILVQTGQRLYVFYFHIPHYDVLNSMDLSRLSTKVIFVSRIHRMRKQRLTRTQPHTVLRGFHALAVAV